MIPVLDIDTFSKDDFNNYYVNDFKSHIKTYKDRITHPHKHDFFLFVYFTKGHGFHEVDFNRYEIKPGALFVICPGQSHFWTLSSDIDGYILFHAPDPMFDKMNTSISINMGLGQFPYLFLSGENLNILDNLFSNLLFEYSNEKRYKNLKILNLIQALHIEILRLGYELTDEIKKVESLQLKQYYKLLEIIEAFYLQEKRPGFYAEKMNISVKHLNRIVNRVVGKSSSRIIQERVSIEGKRMLVHSNESIKEIAFSLGFEDESYFSRYFKNVNKCTPYEFRSQYKF